MSGNQWKPYKNDSISHTAKGLRYLVVGTVFSGLLGLLLLSVGTRETLSASLASQDAAAAVVVVSDDGAQIGNRVWLDANRNGIQDTGEVGVPDITVTLHRSGIGAIATTATDDDGIYTFADVDSGTYAVEFHLPTGYVFSPQYEGGDDALNSDADPLTGLTPDFELADGALDDTWDAGLMPRVVSGKVYFPVAMRTLIPPLLVNGGFEQQAQGWNLINQGLPASIVGQSNDPSVPQGTYSALLGRVDYPCNATGVPLGHAAVEQSYAVPVSSQHVTLRFKYIVWSQDASTSGQYDRFEVFVIPEGGADSLVFSDGNMVNQGLGCNVWRRVPGPQNPRNGQTTGWAEAVVDLDSYKGQTVTFSFRNYSRYDGWYNTYTYLDDVRVVFGN